MGTGTGGTFGAFAPSVPPVPVPIGTTRPLWYNINMKREEGEAMELRVLKYFLVVVREENITKAAEVLHITQPTLSRQLKELEEDVGVTLFQRGTRKITLTDEGLLLRRRAEDIVELVDKTSKELLEQEGEISGDISIGWGEVAAVHQMAELFKAFREKYPLVTFTTYAANANDVTYRMDKGLIDLGLLLEPVSIDKYEYVRLGVKEHWVVIMKATDPLAKKKFITARDLIGKDIILPSRPQTIGEIRAWLGNVVEQIHLNIRSNFSTNASIMVEHGLGYAITIEGALPYLDQSRICARRLRPAFDATNVLAWRRQQPTSSAVAKFIEFAKCFLSIDSHKI
jgi:DNA-binding transcriptional LysR family regulator